MIFPLAALHDLLGNIGSYQTTINERPLPGDCRIRPNNRFWIFVRMGQGGCFHRIANIRRADIKASLIRHAFAAGPQLR